MKMNSWLEESLEQVIERWKRAFTQYNDLKAAAESAVVRWEWTSGERYSLLPFYFNRNPGRGHVLKEIPAEEIYYHQYGFDAQERVHVYRLIDERYLPGEGSLQALIDWGVQVDGGAWETFYDFSGSMTEIIGYSVPPRIALDVQQIGYKDDRVVRYAHFRVNGYTPLYVEKSKDPDQFYEWLGAKGRFKTAERYVYDGSQLSTIVGYHEMPGALPFQCEDRFTYDDTGKLGRIDRSYENGTRQVVYQKRQKGQTFASIREAAVRELVEAVVERLRDAKIKEKVYCVELSYQSGSGDFPPAIIPGLESYRQGLINSDNPDDRHAIFAPILQGKEWFLEITDPDTLEICALLEQEIQNGEKWDVATRILRDIAAELTRYDWTGILDTTPDFVVFAIDHEMEGDDLARVLSGSASKQLIDEWKAKGWL